jgi:predicted nucleic-acid-binding Zn-ribbon protein
MEDFSGNTVNLCAGVIFNSTDAADKCKLKSAAIYNMPRIKDSNYQYYIRTKVGNADASCPQTSEPVDSSKWDTFAAARSSSYSGMGYTGMGANMTSTSKCGMENYVENEVNAVEEQKTLFAGVTNAWSDKITDLKTKYDSLYASAKTNTAALSDEFKNFINNNQNMDFTGDQLKQLQAMTEDQDLLMVSENYKHILWSILAIIIIMGTIKFAKTMAAAPA